MPMMAKTSPDCMLPEINQMHALLSLDVSGSAHLHLHKNNSRLIFLAKGVMGEGKRGTVTDSDTEHVHVWYTLLINEMCSIVETDRQTDRQTASQTDR